jgi:ribosomal protein S18 acetylase RimI-like enzyme
VQGESPTWTILNGVKNLVDPGPAPHRDTASRRDWRLRPAGVDDAEGVLDLWRRAEATVSATDTPEDVRCLIEGWPDSLILAVDGDGVIVGTLIASFDGWRGNLYRLAVEPAYRRRRLATELVAAGEAHLQKLGAKRLTALVESDHPLSMAFWEASDYTFHEAMRRFYKGIR